MQGLETIGQRLAFAIGKSGKSNAEVASWVGMTRQAVAGWISNRTSINIEYAAILAKGLGVSLDWLAGLSDHESRSISHRESLVLRIFNAIEREGLEAILSTIEQANRKPEYAQPFGPAIAMPISACDANGSEY